MSDAQVLVGRYRLIRELGAGAMGTVWLAQDTSLKRQVAVKRVIDSLTPQLGRQAEMARLRAMREGRVAARLSHPNAVGIYDVAIHEGEPWLVMEYVPSRTLTDIVQTHGPIPSQRAALLGTQIASALTEAHRVGIVHRDVKPSNLLLTEEGEAKLTDFGIARSGGDATLTASGLVTGTPAYFAPELARGADPAPASDVWSLGATLYFAVEGVPPFGNDDNPLVLLGRVANQPVPPPARAGELTATIMRLLERDAARRPSMVEARSMLAMLSRGTETIPLALLQEELDTDAELPVADSDGEERQQHADAVGAAESVTEAAAMSVDEPLPDADSAADPDAEAEQETAATVVPEADRAPDEPHRAGDSEETDDEPLDGPPEYAGDTTVDTADGHPEAATALVAAEQVDDDRGSEPPTDGEGDASLAAASHPDKPRRARRLRNGLVLAVALVALGTLGTYLIAIAAPRSGEQAAGQQQSAQQDNQQRSNGSDRAGSRRDTGAGATNPPSTTPSPTPSRTSSPSPDETPDRPTRARMRAPAMERLVARYYGLLPSDTDSSWGMLGPSLREQGRDSYQGWWDLVQSVRVSDLRADPSSNTVTGTVRFVMDSGSTETERHRFGLVKSEDGKQLLINTDERI